MKYSASHLTPFLPTFLCIRRRMHILSAQRDSMDERGPNLSALCFHTLADSFAFSKKPTSSQSSKSRLFFQNTGGGVSPSDFRTLGGSRVLPVWVANRSISVLSVPQWQNNQGCPLPDLHNFSAPANTFRMNTCKSVSKQRTLSPSRMNTYAKTGGGGPHVLS